MTDTYIKFKVLKSALESAVTSVTGVQNVIIQDKDDVKDSALLLIRKLGLVSIRDKPDYTSQYSFSLKPTYGCSVDGDECIIRIEADFGHHPSVSGDVARAHQDFASAVQKLQNIVAEQDRMRR